MDVSYMEAHYEYVGSRGWHTLTQYDRARWAAFLRVDPRRAVGD